MSVLTAIYDVVLWVFEILEAVGWTAAVIVGSCWVGWQLGRKVNEWRFQ